MYETCPRPEGVVKNDEEHPGRYCAVLAGRLYGDPPSIEAELGTLGYLEVDADQWGVSYRHGRQPARRAELDEMPDEPGLLRLVLSQGDLGEQEAQEARCDLERLYLDLARRAGRRPSCERCPYEMVGQR